jgi:DNA-binding NarL/FixJ family response regulator
MGFCYSAFAGRDKESRTALISNSYEGSNLMAKFAQTPRLRPVMSAEQRAKLSAAQRAYVANDPRWEEHRRKLAAANEAHRRSLLPSEVQMILEMRTEGYSFWLIADRLGVCEDVIMRELKAMNIPVDRVSVSAEQRAKLSAAQRAYLESNPKRPQRPRRNVAPSPRRMTLFANEVQAIMEMRRKGRTFSYIAEVIGVCEHVIRRELKAMNISTSRIKADRRAHRGRGFLRSFDEASDAWQATPTQRLKQ